MGHYVKVCLGAALVISLVALLSPRAVAAETPMGERPYSGGDQKIARGGISQEKESQKDMMDMNHYSQVDPRWRDYPLGTQGGTLATSGCGMTAISNGLKVYGIDLTPLEVTKRLQAVGGIAPGGQLNWWSLVPAFQGMPTSRMQIRFLERNATPLDTTSVHPSVDMPVAIKQIQNLVRLGNVVLIQVDAQGIKTGNHWVTVKTTDFLIIDPLDGQEKYMATSFYGPPETGIYGYAAVVGIPTSFPDDGTPKEGVAVGKLSLAMFNIDRDMNIKEAFESLIR